MIVRCNNCCNLSFVLVHVLQSPRITASLFHSFFHFTNTILYINIYKYIYNKYGFLQSAQKHACLMYNSSILLVVAPAFQAKNGGLYCTYDMKVHGGTMVFAISFNSFANTFKVWYRCRNLGWASLVLIWIEEWRTSSE